VKSSPYFSDIDLEGCKMNASNISATIAIQKPTPVRINNGSNGGIQFLVKISRRSTFLMAQVQRLLQGMASGLRQAPYYCFIKERSINIWMLSRQEFDELGFYIQGRSDGPPEWNKRWYYRGIYDPFLDVVLINTEDIDTAEGVQRTLTHEFLHAYSSKVEEIGEGLFNVRTGIHIATLSKHTGEVFSAGRRYFQGLKGFYVYKGGTGRYGPGLNEIITEYLRGRASQLPISDLSDLNQTISILVQKVREEVLFDAYFNGNGKRLEAAVDGIHGIEAYGHLSVLADMFVGGYCKLDDLVGFIRYGYEYYMMKDWGYSSENRAFAPRQLLPSQLPDEIAREVLDDRIKVFTNLTEEDLARFFYKLFGSHMHENLARRMNEWINDHGEEYVALVCIKKKNSGEMILEIHRTERKYLNYPNFLGRLTCTFGGETLYEMV